MVWPSGGNYVAIRSYKTVSGKKYYSGWAYGSQIVKKQIVLALYLWYIETGFIKKGNKMKAAFFEGVAMNLELILQSYRKNMEIDHLILTGGGAKGEIVKKILSDVLHASLRSPNHVEEATSIAAAVIAGVGCGVYQDFSAIHQFLSFTPEHVPCEDVQELYAEAKQTFDQVYQALKPVYKS